MIISFAVKWAPFIAFGTDLVIQVLKKVFSFDRGLFEDRVANFWCALFVLVMLKIRHLFYSTTRNFELAVVNTSLGFFLFSFPVQEKSCWRRSPSTS